MAINRRQEGRSTLKIETENFSEAFFVPENRCGLLLPIIHAQLPNYTVL
jgi:hypothetical protein